MGPVLLHHSAGSHCIMGKGSPYEQTRMTENLRGRAIKLLSRTTLQLLSGTFWDFLQISIGVMSNIIVFPINLVIITLFRKSRARKQRPSRVAQALKESEERKKQVCRKLKQLHQKTVVFVQK